MWGARRRAVQRRKSRSESFWVCAVIFVAVFGVVGVVGWLIPVDVLVALGALSVLAIGLDGVPQRFFCLVQLAGTKVKVRQGSPVAQRVRLEGLTAGGMGVGSRRWIFSPWLTRPTSGS